MPDLQLSIANQIATSASQTSLSVQELITTMKASGMADSAIKQTLMNDLNSGGPLFGSFRNKLKNTVRNGVELSSNGSANGTFTKAGVQEFQWVSVGDGKVCPDCEGRHGETGTMEFFETIGLPASGFSVCTTNCRCQLVPENYKGENLDKPLIKNKRSAFARKQNHIEKDILKQSKNKHEIGVLYDSKGKELLRRKGTAKTVKFFQTDFEGIDMTDTIFTHNHPTSTSFSITDFKFASKMKIKEMRAIAPDHNLGAVVFKIRPKKGGAWPSINKFYKLRALEKELFSSKAMEKWLKTSPDAVKLNARFKDVMARRGVVIDSYASKSITLDEYSKKIKQSRSEWRAVAREASKEHDIKIGTVHFTKQKEIADLLGIDLTWEKL